MFFHFTTELFSQETLWFASWWLCNLATSRCNSSSPHHSQRHFFGHYQSGSDITVFHALSFLMFILYNILLYCVILCCIILYRFILHDDISLHITLYDILLNFIRLYLKRTLYYFWFILNVHVIFYCINSSYITLFLIHCIKLLEYEH